MLMERLLSGKLSKHSEQLNKFVAGFFDSDGCVSVYMDRHTLTLRATLCQTASKDPDFEIMRALHRYYNLGVLTYITRDKGSAVCTWNMGIKDSKKLFNLIGKHLLIKATHYENCIALQLRYADSRVSKEEWVLIKDFKRKSRESSRYLKIPKHISPAYLAGLIAGDGHLQFKRYNGRNKINLCIASGDYVIIELLVRDFKGHYQKQEGCYIWRHPLGKMNRPFVMKVLPKVRKYMLLKTKRDVIDRILTFHKSTRRD